MNLFQSEEHVRGWQQLNPGSLEAGGIIALPDLAALFGTPSRHHMLDGDYLTRWLPQRALERLDVLRPLGKTSQHWLGA